MSRLFFPNAADTVAKHTRARSQEKTIERKKSARVLPFFLSFFLLRCRAQKHGRKALALPQNKEISLFLPFRQLLH
tara:strand:- start:311 stop:538 length:228 start_codon:yes stop_codon:yes gene_type:complete